MNSKYWCYLFFADLIVELTAIAFQWNDIRFATKPLLVAILFIWFLSASSKFSPLRYYIAAALFFSWLGDVFLLMEAKSSTWFIAGLAAFLVAHIIYIIFFLRIRRMQLIKKPLHFLIIALVVIYAAGLFALLYPHIGNLKLPVALYAITISTMLIVAIHSFNDVTIARWCVAGAALFVVSDSLLSINKFYQSFTSAGVSIMLSYGLAQFSIAKGSLQYLAQEKYSV